MEPVTGLLTLLLTLPAGIAADTGVSYALRFGDRYLEVRATYPAGATDTVTLSMSQWGGITDFARHITGVAAADASGGNVVMRAGEGSWHLEGIGAGFVLTYRVESSKTTFMGEGPRDFLRPTLLGDWAFLWGNSWVLWPSVARLAVQPARLTVDPGPYRRAWASWDGGRPLRGVDAVGETVLVAGRFREVSREVSGARFRILVTGTRWRFSDTAFAVAVTAAIGAQRAMLGSPPDSVFTVVLAEGTPTSAGGTAVPGAIVVYPNVMIPSPLEDMETLRLIAHEYLHAWNGGLLRAASDHAEGWYKWFQEGITEYLAWRSLHRGGLVSGAAFLRAVNRRIEEYARNPAALTATADTLAAGYWTRQELHDLPYVKGFLLGWLLELEGGAVDRMLRALLERTGRGAIPYDDALLQATLEEAAGGPRDAFYRDFMLGAAPLPLAEACRAAGLRCEEREGRVEFLFDQRAMTFLARLARRR